MSQSHWYTGGLQPVLFIEFTINDNTLGFQFQCLMNVRFKIIQIRALYTTLW